MRTTHQFPFSNPKSFFETFSAKALRPRDLSAQLNILVLWLPHVFSRPCWIFLLEMKQLALPPLGRASVKGKRWPQNVPGNKADKESSDYYCMYQSHYLLSTEVPQKGKKAPPPKLFFPNGRGYPANRFSLWPLLTPT
jgi:hypothetical protein